MNAAVTVHRYERWARFTLGACVALVLMSRAVIGQENRFVCNVRNITTAWGFAKPPISIDRHSVEFTDSGRSTVAFYVRNQASSRIRSLAMVIRYVGEEDRVIDDIPIAVVAGSQKPENQLPFAVEEVQSWPQILAPAGDAIVSGVYDGIRTGICPVRAEVTFVRIVFEEQPPVELWSPGWEVRPIPRAIPPVPETIAHLNAPTFVDAELTIGSSGAVEELVSGESDKTEAINWLREYLTQNWKFYPALHDGIAVSYKSRLVVDFSSDPEIVPESDVRSPVLLIHVFRKPDHRLSVFFGQMSEGDVLGGGSLKVIPD